MDYLKDDDAPSLAGRPAEPAAERNPQAGTPAEVDPLLRELLPTDRNVRRRVVAALLRGVLLDGGRSS